MPSDEVLSKVESSCRHVDSSVASSVAEKCSLPTLLESPSMRSKRGHEFTNNVAHDPEAIPAGSFALVSAIMASVCTVQNSRTLFIVACVALYYVSAILCYMSVEPDSFRSVGECIYFATVLFTTVGYGDYTPKSDAGKLITVVFAHFALIIVAAVFASITKEIIQHTLYRVQNESNLGLLDEAGKRWRRAVRFTFFLAMYACTVAVGTLFYAASDDLEGHQGTRWVNALYLTVMTLTTIGFGDLAPKSPGGHTFACALMIVGIPAFGAALGCASEFISGENQARTRLKMVQGLDERKFMTMQSFCGRLMEEGVYGNVVDTTRITRFEFLCFVLVRNGAIEIDAIKQIMGNFNKLDHNGTGFLESKDFEDVTLETNHIDGEVDV